MENLTEQMMQYEPTLALDEKVSTLTSEDGLVTMGTEKGHTHYAKSAIIAAGVGAFMPRKIAQAGLDELEGRGLHYFVTDKTILAGKRLLVVGGGDSAFDWTLNLYDSAQSIMQIHRSDKYKAHEDTVQKVMALPIEFKTFTKSSRSTARSTSRASPSSTTAPRKSSTYECDEILFSLGFLTNLGPIKQWGFDIVGNSVHVKHAHGD